MPNRPQQPPLSPPLQERRIDARQTGLEESVRRRAYEIYQQRGEAGGSDIEDWLQAEAEVLGDDSADEAA